MTKVEQQHYEINSSLKIMVVNTILMISLANFRFDPFIDLFKMDLGLFGGHYDEVRDVWVPQTLEFLLPYMPILNGSLEGVTVGWYYKVGRMLCFFILVNTLFYIVQRVGAYRLFRLRQKIDARDPSGTKQKCQQDLNELYTGP